MPESVIEEGRAAHGGYQWQLAYTLLRQAAQAGPLVAEDLERLAESAMWVGEFEACTTVREQAFALRVAADERQRAAALALDLCLENVVRQRISIALGWVSRAQELLATEPSCVEQARLEDLLGLGAMFLDGDIDAALGQFQSAADLAREVGHSGVAALASMHAATALVRKGEVSAAMREVDRTMTAAVAGELDPVSTARVYCGAISLCQALGDLRRAREWSEEAARCATRPGLSGFPGDCRLHQAELTRLAGDWDRAEAEIERAMPELERYDRAHVAEAWYDLGEIWRLRGDFELASDAYARAEGLGRAPQPGRARLQLALGEESRAAAMLTSALASSVNDPPLEAALLAAVVEAHLACDDPEAAGRANARLGELAARFATVTLLADAAFTECLAAEPPAGVIAGRRAVALWRDAGAPYECARAQQALADAYRRSGQPDVARIELDAALSTFRALGARFDADRAELALTRLGNAKPGRRVRRTFVFTDIVDSTRLVAGMGDDAWATVLLWHDRTIRMLLDRHGGEEVKQRGGGDGFFAVFTSAKAAVDCAVDIQTAFAQHRDQQGFAPPIRIGVHEADALRHAGDYSGLGVHEAARIAELAGAHQITASASTGRSAAATINAPGQATHLRGLPEPVELVQIIWQDNTEF